MRLRQLALVASDLEPVVKEMCDRLGLEVCYHDPGVGHFGLHNALMAVGDQFLEVVAPIKEGTTAGRYLERRRGDGGYMVILQVPDLNSARQRVERLGVRIVWEGSVPGIAGMHLHPKDVGGAILSLDCAEPPDGWPWAGPEWRQHVRSDVVSGIAAAEIQSDDPRALARRWSEILDIEGVDGPEGSAVIALDSGLLRFVHPRDDRGEGLVGIQLSASDRSRAGEDHEIGGVTFRLV
ncbi:MAG TPA: VOC family protein [Acidimicrobiales bacterium]|nr:VOC family protein [Acidimicrobiales bacterium]